MVTPHVVPQPTTEKPLVPPPATALGSHLLSTADLDKTQVEQLYARAEWISDNRESSSRLLDGKRLGVLFYQNSTRTRMSFVAAMQQLGGSTVGFDDVRTTRAGDFFQESLNDTAGVIGQYADALVLRHTSEGAAARAADSSPVPVINGGDGGNEHPTQALLDLWMMRRLLGELTGITVGLVGDPDCRDFRSLIYLLITYRVGEIVVAMPAGCGVATDEARNLAEADVSWRSVEDVGQLVQLADIVSMLPVRLPSFNTGTAGPDAPVPPAEPRLCFDRDTLTAAAHVPILHVGPRGQELPEDLDDLPNIHYLAQAGAGVHLRAAILEGLIVARDQQTHPGS